MVLLTFKQKSNQIKNFFSILPKRLKIVYFCCLILEKSIFCLGSGVYLVTGTKNPDFKIIFYITTNGTLKDSQTRFFGTISLDSHHIVLVEGKNTDLSRFRYWYFSIIFTLGEQQQVYLVRHWGHWPKTTVKEAKTGRRGGSDCAKEEQTTRVPHVWQDQCRGPGAKSDCQRHHGRQSGGA
jgi:hypothetical protein